MMQAVLAIASGAVAGFVLGLTGGGGAILGTPLILYVVGVRDPHVAIGTGVAATSAAALSNFATHVGAGNVRWRSAAVFAVVGASGAFAGSTLGKLLDGERLLALLGLLMVGVAGLMFRGRRGPRQPVCDERGSTGAVAGLALGAGFASGFFGVGGGFLIVPCLIAATGMPMIEAVGSSLLAVTAFAVTTAVNYARSGLVDWPVAGWFVLGGVIGGFAGTRLACHLGQHKDRLQRLVALMILGAAAYILYRSIGALEHTS